MSSSEVAAEINHYNTSIPQKEAQIASLRAKIDEQGQVKDKFSAKKDNCNTEYTEKQNHSNTVNGASQVNVFAQRFSEKMEDYVSAYKNMALQEHLDSIDTKMQAEINDNWEKVVELEQQLTNERNILSQLQVDYQNALAAEEAARKAEEAAQAAAAEAAANANHKP